MSETSKTVMRILAVVFIIASILGLFFYKDMSIGVYRFFVHWGSVLILVVGIVLIALSFLSSRKRVKESV